MPRLGVAPTRLCGLCLSSTAPSGHHQVGWGGVGRGRWRRLLAWLPVHGIATVSSGVLAPVMVVLGPLLVGTRTDYPNQLGAAGRVGENAKAVEK